MNNRNDEAARGVDTVLGQVLERLREEARVELRLLREQHTSDIAEMRHRYQLSFGIALGVFIVICAVLLGSTFWSLRSVLAQAETQAAAQVEAARRLDLLEERARGQLETLEMLERRLRAELLGRGVTPGAGSPERPADVEEAGDALADSPNEGVREAGEAAEDGASGGADESAPEG